MSIVKLLYRKKWFILVVALIFMLGSASLDFVVNYNRQTMTLSFVYPEIQKGLNPDGTTFNIFEIKSNAVLDRAIELSGLQGYTVDDIKDRIDVTEKNPLKSTEKILERSIGGSQYTYVPNEFLISYSQKAKLDKNHTVTMLESIAQAYREYFVENYGEKSTVLQVEDFQPGEYEYAEIADMITNKINAMIGYLQAHQAENSEFKSDTTQQTIASITERLINLRDIEVVKYKSFVIHSSLARNKKDYVDKLNYLVNKLTLDYNKKVQDTEFIKDAINKYDPRITGVIYIPSVDAENKFYMNRTQTGLDYLTKTAHEIGTESKEILKSINEKTYLIQAFSQPDHEPQEQQRLVESAESMIREIMDTLQEISEIAIQTDQDFMTYITGDYMQFIMPEGSFRSFISIKKMLVMFCLGAVLTSAYFLLRSYYASKKKQLLKLYHRLREQRLARK